MRGRERGEGGGTERGEGGGRGRGEGGGRGRGEGGGRERGEGGGRGRGEGGGSLRGKGADTGANRVTKLADKPMERPSHNRDRLCLPSLPPTAPSLGCLLCPGRGVLPYTPPPPWLPLHSDSLPTEAGEGSATFPPCGCRSNGSGMMDVPFVCVLWGGEGGGEGGVE